MWRGYVINILFYVWVETRRDRAVLKQSEWFNHMFTFREMDLYKPLDCTNRRRSATLWKSPHFFRDISCTIFTASKPGNVALYEGKPIPATDDKIIT